MNWIFKYSAGLRGLRETPNLTPRLLKALSSFSDSFFRFSVTFVTRKKLKNGSLDLYSLAGGLIL